MKMLSALFPIQTNSLLSFHDQSSVLLHQGTTFKELLSLVLYSKRVVQDKVSLTFTFMHQVTLTFEAADVPPTPQYRHLVVKSRLHKVTLTFTLMHQVVLTFEDADIPPWYSHLMVKSTTMLGQLDIYIHASGWPAI